MLVPSEMFATLIAGTLFIQQYDSLDIPSHQHLLHKERELLEPLWQAKPPKETTANWRIHADWYTAGAECTGCPPGNLSMSLGWFQQGRDVSRISHCFSAIPILRYRLGLASLKCRHPCVTHPVPTSSSRGWKRRPWFMRRYPQLLR